MRVDQIQEARRENQPLYLRSGRRVWVVAVDEDPACLVAVTPEEDPDKTLLVPGEALAHYWA